MVDRQVPIAFLKMLLISGDKWRGLTQFVTMKMAFIVAMTKAPNAYMA